MRKETQTKEVICASCKKPITKEQRPSVKMANGDEVHASCWNRYTANREQKPN